MDVFVFGLLLPAKRDGGEISAGLLLCWSQRPAASTHDKPLTGLQHDVKLMRTMDAVKFQGFPYDLLKVSTEANEMSLRLKIRDTWNGTVRVKADFLLSLPALVGNFKA